MAQQLERVEAAFGSIESIPKKPPVRANFVPEPLLDTFEAAAIMKIHPKTLQKLARAGRIPGVHVGKLWRFRASVIDSWIAGQMAG